MQLGRLIDVNYKGEFYLLLYKMTLKGRSHIKKKNAAKLAMANKAFKNEVKENPAVEFIISEVELLKCENSFS